MEPRRRACRQCHNESINRDVIAFRANFMERFAPTENDGYVLRDSTGVRVAELTRVGFGAVPMTLSLLAFCIGTLLLFPVGLGLALLNTGIERRKEAGQG